MKTPQCRREVFGILFIFKEPKTFFMPNKNLSLTYRWMEQVWNRGSEDAIDEMLDANAIVHGIEGIDEPGPSGFKIFHRSFKEGT